MTPPVRTVPIRFEIDLAALLRSLSRALPYLVVFACVVAAVVYLALGAVPPLYRSEARIRIEPATIDRASMDSEVQLVRSRDVARSVVRTLGLENLPEYATHGSSLIDDILARLGLASNPLDASVEERILNRYFERLDVYPIAGEGIIVIAFSSTDPGLAAAGANAVADAVVALHETAGPDSTAEALKRLEAEIAGLRTDVAEAEAKVEAFRAANAPMTNGASQTNQPDRSSDAALRLLALEHEAAARRDLLEGAMRRQDALARQGAPPPVTAEIELAGCGSGRARLAGHRSDHGPFRPSGARLRPLLGGSAGVCERPRAAVGDT